MVTVMRDTPARRESTASGVTLLGTNADLRATFVHAFNRRHRRAQDDNFTGNLSIETKASRVNIFAVFKGDVSSWHDRFKNMIAPSSASFNYLLFRHFFKVFNIFFASLYTRSNKLDLELVKSLRNI